MVVNKSCNGKCSNCGGCCNPWNPITIEEVNQIKAYIKKHNIEPVPMRDGDNVYMDCCFHDRENKRCLIYPVRPEVCKNFSCSHGKERIDKDKLYYDRRADFNGVHLNKLYPFDLLFYDKPDALMYLMWDVAKPQCEEDVKKFLVDTGHPDLAECVECKFASK